MGGPATGVEHRGVAHYEAERAVALTFRGHVSVAEMTRLLLGAGTVVAGASHGVTGVLWDGSEHESHDPLVVSQAVKWSLEHRSWYRRSALVARSARIASLLHIAKVMCPWLEAEVFATREEALAWLARAMPEPASRRGGRRRAA